MNLRNQSLRAMVLANRAADVEELEGNESPDQGEDLQTRGLCIRHKEKSFSYNVFSTLKPSSDEPEQGTCAFDFCTVSPCS